MPSKVRAALKFVGPASLGAGILLAVCGYQEGWAGRQIAREGIEVKTELVSRRIVKDRWGVPSFLLTLEYVPEGGVTSIVKEFDVPRRVYTSCEACDPIMVRHLSQDPSFADVSDADVKGSEPIGIGAFLVAAGVGVSTFAFRKRTPILV